MAKEKNEWVKFTLRLNPETVYLMHKYCKQPSPILRNLVESWVRELVRKALEKEEKLKQVGSEINWEDNNGRGS